MPHLAEGGYVASFQNGLNEFVIGEVVGIENVIGAFINFGADYMAPGRIPLWRQGRLRGRRVGWEAERSRRGPPPAFVALRIKARS